MHFKFQVTVLKATILHVQRTCLYIFNRKRGPLLWLFQEARPVERGCAHENARVCVFSFSPSYRTNNWKQIMLQVKKQPVISSNGPSAAPK